MRFAKTLVGLAMFTGALMASGAALAVPVINAGGIGVPLGADQISQTDSSLTSMDFRSARA